MVEDVQPDREMQHHFNDEQQNRRRQRRLPEGEQHQRNTHVARVGEHHGRQEGLGLDPQQRDQRQQQQAGTEHHRHAAEGQIQKLGGGEGFGGQCPEHQQWRQHLHVDLVKAGEVRSLPTGVQPADAGGGKDGENNAGNAPQHASIRQKPVAYHRDLVVGHQCWCVAHAGKFDQCRLGATLGHDDGVRVVQHIGVLAA